MKRLTTIVFSLFVSAVLMAQARCEAVKNKVADGYNFWLYSPADIEENMELNRGNLRFSNVELTKVGVTIAKVKVAVHERRKKKG